MAETNEIASGGERKRMLEWISKVDMEEKHLSHRSKHVPGTCEWLLRTPVFMEWASEEGEEQVLWCPGLPGTGKSVLVSTVIEHIHQLNPSPDVAVVYFYCNNYKQRPANMSTAYDILSSICRQLVAQCVDEGIQKRLISLHDRLSGTQADVQGYVNFDDMMDVIMRMCDMYRRVFIFIDGIDDCDQAGERDILLPKLWSIRDRGAKIFASSTLHGDIQSSCHCHDDLEDAFRHVSRLDLVAPQEDLSKVVSHWLNAAKAEDLILVDSGPGRPKLVEKISRGCSGSFVVADLLLKRELRRPSDSWDHAWDSEVMKAIRARERNDESLDTNEASITWQAGLQALQRRDPLRREVGLRTLTWATHQYTPLYANSLCQTLMFELGKPYYFLVDETGREIRVGGIDVTQPASAREKDAWERATPLVEICENLITISEHCQLFLRDPSIRDDLWTSSFPQGDSQLATACLKFLKQAQVVRSNQNDDERTFINFPFKPYAQANWAAHAKAASDCSVWCSDVPLDESAIEYLQLLERFPIRSILEDRYEQLYEIIEDETAILKAARNGLTSVLSKLLRSPAYDIRDINHVSYKGESALFVAVNGGHVESAMLLHRYGASIHHKTRSGLGLVHVATERDDEVMVGTLVFFGLDPNIDRLGSGTALQRAAHANSLRAAKVLLDERADIYKTGRDGDVMHIAASEGHLEFAELLVSYGFDLSTLSCTSTRGKFPPYLSCAVRSGSLPLVSYMISNGAKVFELNSHKDPALAIAVRRGYSDIVQLLRDHGAELFEETHEVDVVHERSNGSS